MAGMNDHELTDVSLNVTLDDTGVVDLQSLPPVDRGRHAWLTLTACFFLEATVWGYAGCSANPFVLSRY